MYRPGRRQAIKHIGGALVSSLLSCQERARGATARAPRIKIGQIGVGHGHANKLEVFRKSADYEVVGVVEENPELRRRAESHDAFRGLRWMARDQLLAFPG